MRTIEWFKWESWGWLNDICGKGEDEWVFCGKAEDDSTILWKTWWWMGYLWEKEEDDWVFFEKSLRTIRWFLWKSLERLTSFEKMVTMTEQLSRKDDEYWTVLYKRWGQMSNFWEKLRTIERFLGNDEDDWEVFDEMGRTIEKFLSKYRGWLNSSWQKIKDDWAVLERG